MSNRSLVTSLKKFWRSPWGRTSQTILSLAVLFFFARMVDWSAVWSDVQLLTWPWVCLIGALALLRNLWLGLRFQLLVSPFARLPLGQLVEQYFIAGMFNMLLPSAFGGEGVRGVLVARAGVPASETVFLILLERLLGLASLLCLSAVSALWFPPAAQWLGWWLWAVVVAGVVGLWGVFFTRIPVPTFGFQILQRVTDIITQLRAHRWQMLGVFGLSLVLQINSVSISIIIGTALGLPVPLAAYFALVPLVWVAMMVPGAPGGVGLREGAFTLLFTTLPLLAIPAESSMALSLLTYASLLFNALVGGAVFLWAANRKHS